MNYITRKFGVASANLGLLFTMYFTHFNIGMMAVLQGGLLPYIREEYNLTYAQSGLLLSSHQIGNLSAVMLVGVLPLFIGKKKSALLLGPFAVIGFLLVTLFGGLAVLVLAYALIGIGRGTMSNTDTNVVSEISTNRASALSSLNAFFALGALSAPLLLVFGANIPFGWRAAPYALSIIAIVAFVFLARSTMSNKPTVKTSGGSFAFLKTSNFWLNSGVLFCYLAAEATIVGWFQVFFENTGLLPANIARVTPTLLWVMILIGRLSCAAIPQRINKNRILLIFGAVFSISFVVIITTGSTALAIICLVIVGLSMAGMFPLTIAVTDNTASSAVTGTLMAVAISGAIIMPSIVGLIADAFSLTAGLNAVIIPLSVMLILLIVKNLPNKRKSGGN